MITDLDIEKLKKIFLQKLGSATQLVTSIIQWTNIVGKPTMFPPEAHDHDDIYLNIANTTPFTPDADYEPATKKYVDDNSGGGLLNKLDATTAPTVNDDSGDGFEIGSLWIDVTHDQIYQCTDASVGAAVWKCLSPVILDDAPSDGNTYGRRNGDWYAFEGGGGGEMTEFIFSLGLGSLGLVFIEDFSATITYAE